MAKEAQLGMEAFIQCIFSFQPSISSFLAATVIQMRMREIHIVQIAVNFLHLFSLRCILLVKSWDMELICCISLAVYQVVMCNFLGNVH